MKADLALLGLGLALILSAAPAMGQQDSPELARLEKHVAELSSGAPMEAYLADQMKRAGLKAVFPRGKYTQEFDGGVNVAGSVPGRHPQFKERAVVVVVNDPREVYGGGPARGASAGAALAAVLLAAAEAFSKQPCQRSLLWVAFNPGDGRGQGADYFFSHLPVRAEQIVLCVHLGALGRAYGDFMNGVVWTAGMQYCPELEELITATTAEAGLYVLPTAAEVLGLASSHEESIKQRIPSMLFSVGEHGDSGSDTDVAARLDMTGLARFSRYLATLVRLMGNAPGTPQCRPESAPFASEFCSYAVECGVLINLSDQGRLPFSLPSGVVDDASGLRATCIDLCEAEPLPAQEAARVQKQARQLNQEVLRALRQRRARTPQAAIADAATATGTPALSDFAPPSSPDFRQGEGRPATEFVIPEGGIEVVNVKTATPEAPAMPIAKAEHASPMRPATAGAEIGSVTRTIVIRPATGEIVARPKAAAAKIKPPTKEAAPPKVDEKKPDGRQFLKPPEWLGR